MMKRMKPAKRTVVESLAIAIARSEWTVVSASKMMKSLFRRKQDWIPSLAERIIIAHPNPVSVHQLQKLLVQDSVLRQIIKTKNLKPLDVTSILDRGCVASLDWRLPRFSNVGDLASRLGITASGLKWLTSRHLPADQRPRHYVATWIRKRSRGYRLIESPKPLLKRIQRQILSEVVDLIPPHYVAHGFRKGRDVVSFARQHVGKAFCLRMDMKDFFPSISAARVRGIFRATGYDRDVSNALANLCTTQTHEDVVQQKRPPGQLGVCDVSRLYLPAHLPQGAPTSPGLANLAAYRFDCRLSGLADKFGATYTRYADDLLFSAGKSLSRIANQFSIYVGAIAIEEGFEINFRKTRLQNSSQRQTAAGVILNQKVNLARNDFDQLKAILHNCVKHGPQTQNRSGVPDFHAHLHGRIQWAARLNPSKAQKLFGLFEKIDWTESNDQSH